MNHRDTEDTESKARLENQVSDAVIGAAIEVHKALGPGLLESVYEACMRRELDLRGVTYQQQQSLPIEHKGERVDCGYRLDLIVQRVLIVELKSVEQLLPIHEAQLLTYLRLTGIHLGLLINFNVPLLRQGVKRMVNGYL